MHKINIVQLQFVHREVFNVTHYYVKKYIYFSHHLLVARKKITMITTITTHLTFVYCFKKYHLTRVL